MYAFGGWGACNILGKFVVGGDAVHSARVMVCVCVWQPEKVKRVL